MVLIPAMHVCRFEVEFLSSRPAALGAKSTVFAIQGPDVSIEAGLLKLFCDTTACQAPLLPHILSHEPSKKISEGIRLGNTAEKVCKKFGLNADQEGVLRHVASWGDPGVSRDPVCLVHGPFGTGKSQLIVAILNYILERKRSTGSGDVGLFSKARIMVCSHTNIAVDRVLLGLLNSGVSNFIRVGGLRKIHEKLLPYSLHASESKTFSSAISELKHMANSASGERLKEIQREIKEAEQGSERKRKKFLKSSPIVGVTCVSTALSVLENQHFDILILDEASQMTEPLSLAPIIRSKCNYIIAAGDPCQLPPVITSPENVDGGGQGLLRPLFVRLASLGCQPYLLRTQYRCHPYIAALANKNYYSNKLLDGILPQDRAPVIPDLPPLSAVHIMGHESYSGRSIMNESEARAAATIVRGIARAGIDSSKVGIICFYRAQVNAVRRCIQLAYRSDGLDDYANVEVATVDSFQGAERDIILLTTATTKPSEFASDACRMNVALTRAKNHLIVLGNLQVLCQTAPVFNDIMTAVRSSNAFFSGGLPMLPSQAI